MLQHGLRPQQRGHLVPRNGIRTSNHYHVNIYVNFDDSHTSNDNDNDYDDIDNNAYINDYNHNDSSREPTMGSGRLPYKRECPSAHSA